MCKRFAMYLAALVILIGCEQTQTEITKQDILDSFSEAGLSGEEKDKNYAMIGAVDGFGFQGEEFSVELYKYRDSDCSICQHLNGNWGMFVHKDERYSEEITQTVVSAFMAL